MSKKKQIFITELLYFNEDKFKTHLKKRINEGVVKDKDEYIKIILDILNNYERLFIVTNSYRKKYLLLRTDEWLLIFDEEYRVSTAYQIHKKYACVENLLEQMVNDKLILKYWEVKDERSKYKRFVKRLQKRN